jgi:hypothetical protein
MNKQTLTKGNVIVENINVGDIHYEFEYNMCIKSEVTSKPTRDPNGYWSWASKNVNNGTEIRYGVNEGHPHYGPNLYDHEAYKGTTHI